MKNNLKGIIAMILAGGFILPLTGCSRNVGHYSVDNSKEITSNTQPVEDNTDCVEDETLSQKKVYSDEFFEELRCYVDEDIYLNLKNAKDNFDGLFIDSEDITTRMKKVGISLTDADSDFINDGVNNIYSLICNYIISYESGDYNSCIDIFKKLINCYKSGLSKDFLFKILVSNNLPIEYQSPIKYDEYGNMYDSSFNIKLKNNKLIRLIGLNDNLIINDIEYFDKYNNSYLISKWFQELPNSLICKYSVINNSSDNDGICYFCNETKTNEVCNKEYYQVIEDGREMYGFNDDNIQIIPIDENYSKNCFVDSNQKICGELTYDQNSIIGKINMIRNALNTKDGDVLVLDSYIKGLYNKYNVTYNK